MMKRFSSSHPIGFIRTREINNVISSWNGIADARAEEVTNFYRKNLYAHYGCVNAIEFSNDGSLLLSAGDDRRILLWNFHQAIHGNCTPVTLQAEHTSNVFTVGFNSNNTRIFSGGNDDQVIIHDTLTGKPLDYFPHEQPVYGISVDPMNDYIFASACDDGRLLIYDIREPASTEPFCLATTTAAFHAVMFNPTEPRLVVSANSKKGVALWDVRMPEKSVMNYGGNNSEQCCMSARFNQDGSRILALRRRLPPILYATESTNHLFQFNHLGYYNSCTMKSCTFAGSNDQFVVSGSDNFDLYMWKIPDEIPPVKSPRRFVKQAQLVLHGHRSIVNQVRYNPKYSVIASSGVEKMVKLWSPFPLPTSKEGKSTLALPADKERQIYSHSDYINLVMQSGQFLSLTFDTSRRNTREDPRMMAFFDALVQRDIDGMTDDDELPSPKVSYTDTIGRSGSSSNSGTEEPSRLGRGSSLMLVEFNNDEESDAGDEAQEQPNPESSEPEAEVNVDSDSNDSNEESVSNTNRKSTTLASTKQNSASTSSSQSSRLETGTRSPNLGNPRQDNLITKLIAGKQDQLLRMARAHATLELNGRQKVKRKKPNIFQRLRKLNKKTCSLTMNLLPLPGDEEEDSSSGSANEAPQLPMSSSSSSSSSSDSDDNLDKRLMKLKTNIKPLLIRRPEPQANHEESAESSDSVEQELETPANGRRRRHLELQETQKHQQEFLNRQKKRKRASSVPSRAVAVVDDNQPCTSASVLQRDAELAKARKKSQDKKERKTKHEVKSSTSSSDSDESLESHKSDFIARLQEVSRRLKRVSQELVNSTQSSSTLLRRLKKRKQQSTMINSPSSSSMSSNSSSTSSSSSSSDSESQSSGSGQFVVDKLPPPKKRRRVQESEKCRADPVVPICTRRIDDSPDPAPSESESPLPGSPCRNPEESQADPDPAAPEAEDEERLVFKKKPTKNFRRYREHRESDSD